ncbi:hypothetical protein F4561_003939 [Lipingzhangella halophila]|uniref:LysM domain-containing protein n=1 Tax=Lipingzhangella halophila TaxID=1783352 RepID=A0A7W7W4S3_9ACTN|nr:LysM peptidoglycan-binding domain-containing protein [Lipingzhangella halophila]MBB4933119.1 hypothetical protein [Lipingzhangella halophila]
MSEPVLRRPPRPVVPSGQLRRTRNHGGAEEAAQVRPTAAPSLYDWAVEIPEWDPGDHKQYGRHARIPILADLPDLFAADPGTPGAVPVPGGSRLTRRGRVVLVAALTVAATSALSLLFLATARAGDLPVSPPGTSAVQGGAGDLDWTDDGTVVVEDGDTLWEIAEETRPGEDPRRTVHEIVELNDLDGSDVNPGQEIVVPVS